MESEFDPVVSLPGGANFEFNIVLYVYVRKQTFGGIFVNTPSDTYILFNVALPNPSNNISITTPITRILSRINFLQQGDQIVFALGAQVTENGNIVSSYSQNFNIAVDNLTANFTLYPNV